MSKQRRNKMKKITVEEIMKLDPCYTEEKVKDLIGKGKTPLEILDLPISKSDKFWLLLRPKYISEKRLHLLACDFAQDVAHMNPDPRVQAAIDAKRLWIDGKITDEELKKARAAAYAADAADAATYAAYAAYAATYAADAADAASSAASAADVDINIGTKQIEMVRKVFIDMGEIK